MKSFEYPICKRTEVKIIGSKKAPIFPINLLPVEGIEIFKTFFKYFLFGIKSFLQIFFLGRQIVKIIIDDSSLIILDITKKKIVISIPFVKKIGIPIIKIINLKTSSIILEKTCGNNLSFP